MTSNIINLRHARKAKVRAEKEKRARENRVKFGRSKAERQKTGKVIDIERARLEGTRLANPDDDGREPGAAS